MSSAHKTNRFTNELQTHLEGVTAQHFAAQRLRLRQEWEPRLVGELIAIAGECGLLLGEAVGEYAATTWTQRNQGAMRLRLSLGFMKIARQHAEAARGLLERMTRSEADARAGALTINGMLAEPPRLWESHQAMGGLERLSHGPILERAVIQGCHRFTRWVMAYLNTTDLDKGDLVEAQAHLDGLVKRWRNQLATVARTTLYSAAGNAKQVVSRTLQ